MNPAESSPGPTSGFRPTSAMLLAAGHGKRLRPITESLPKPLVAPGGRSLLDRSLDRLAAAGVEKVVVNLHHLGEQIESRVKERLANGDAGKFEVVFSREEELLETGGGVARALAELGDEPFYVVNGDSLWLDGIIPALARLASNWDEEEMDALLLLHPTAFAPTYSGAGDFFMTPEGRVRRRGEREVAPFVFAGVQILSPRLFKDVPEGSFSLNLLYDRAAEAERLWGLRHDGEWFEVGTPEALEQVEAALRFLDSFSVHR